MFDVTWFDLIGLCAVILILELAFRIGSGKPFIVYVREKKESKQDKKISRRADPVE